MKYSLFILLTSCSFFLNKFDQDILEEKDIKPISNTKQTYCEIIQKNILISESDSAINLYQSFIQQLSKKVKLKFIDKLVLWSLVQMNSRPDLSTPQSKFQLFINYRNKNYFYNSYSEDPEAYPAIHLLNYLLKEYQSRFTLQQLASLYQRYFPAQLTVSKELEAFLTTHQLKIKKNATLNQAYIRGDESLKEGETLPKINFVSIVRGYRRAKRNYQINDFLFVSKTEGSFESSCNFEISLYKNSIFLINDDVIKAHTFGLKDGNNIFLGTTVQGNTQITPIANSPFFTAHSNVRSAAMCNFKNLKTKQQIWTISSQSRDPGQHIFHLLEYGLQDIKNIQSLDTMMKFSRHQFLKNPVRLVIESRRSSEKQVNELLKLNIPIYNAKKLGKIWSYFQSQNQNSFILDDRRDGNIECSSN